MRGPPEPPKQPDWLGFPPKQRMFGKGIVLLNWKYSETVLSQLGADIMGRVISY